MKKIENEELIKKILACLNKNDFENFTDEDLAGIRNISFEYMLINGKLTGITIEDIIFFPNLESLTLKGYTLSMKDLQLITDRKGIENLSFIRCTFDDIDFDKLSNLPENLKFISCNRLPGEFPKVKKVNIELSFVDFGTISLNSVSEILIRNSEVKNAHNIEEYENIRVVNFDGSKLIGEDGQEIQDIKVPENTLYSHEDERRYETIENTHKNEENLER